MANNNSALMTLANTIRKEQHLSMKEAFAAARAQLAKVPTIETPVDNTLAAQLDQKLKAGAVRFTYKNRAGKEVTTRGTNEAGYIHKRVAADKRSVIPGRKEAKSADSMVFFDLDHGCYRPVAKSSIMKIF